MAGYGDDSGFTAWLAANGYVLPAGAPSPAVLRQRGSTYIDGLYGPRFSGVPTGGFAQERAWPRTDACAYGSSIGSGIIPDAVVQASYFAAYAEAVAPGSLSTTYTPGTAKVLTEVKGIKWEVVGDASEAGAMIPVISAVEGLLAPFLIQPLPGIVVV
jgi:hypothetical protein